MKNCKCRVSCKSCKVVRRENGEYDTYCIAQKDMPRVNPFEEDCPYMIKHKRGTV